MPGIPNIVPITDLRQDASSVVKELANSRDPVFITQRGRATAVILSMRTYERTQRELEILKLLANGEKEIAAGKGYDLDAIITEADSLLASLKR